MFSLQEKSEYSDSASICFTYNGSNSRNVKDIDSQLNFKAALGELCNDRHRRHGRYDWPKVHEIAEILEIWADNN